MRFIVELIDRLRYRYVIPGGDCGEVVHRLKELNKYTLVR